MNFLEAVKTGLPMKRIKWLKYGRVDEAIYGREDYLAEDWEVKQAEPEKILLTRDEVQKALLSYFGPYHHVIRNAAFIKLLGFKE